ncbi:hypoxia-inducible factor prolyl 4-hydroxylase [Sarotherodon galilaeus]
MMAASTDAAETAAEDTHIHKWSKEETAELIKLRGENEHLFTGARNTAAAGWRAILEQMGLAGQITPLQAEKKWDNLKKKYKVCAVPLEYKSYEPHHDCKYPATGEGVSGKTTAATWPWFVPMDEVLGQRPSTRPPVLIASTQEDTPGPSTAAGTQGQDVERQEDEAQLEAQPKKRKRDREDEVMELIKEDMRLQRERMDRIITLLEKVVEKQNE